MVFTVQLPQKMHKHTHSFLIFLHLPHKKSAIRQFGFANNILKPTNQISINSLAICKISICIIVYRLHVTILYQTRPTHVQLNSNTLTHISHQRYAIQIQIIRTVAPKDQPIHQQLNATQIPAPAAIIIAHPELQPRARVQVITATVQPQAADYLMELHTATIHTVSKRNKISTFT